MRKICAATAVVILLGACPALAKDEDKAKSEGPADKKRQAFDQILDTIESNKLTEEEKEQLKAKGKERMNHLLDVYAEKTHMTEEEKTKLKEKYQNHPDAPKREMPPGIKEKLDKTFGDCKSFGKDMSFQVLSDHFDEKDMKAINKFLLSSTGKKLIKGLPDMVGQAVSLTVEHYMPALIDLTQTMRNFAPPMMMPNPGGSPLQRQEMMEKLKRMMEQMQHPKLPSTSPKDET